MKIEDYYLSMVRWEQFNTLYNLEEEAFVNEFFIAA